MIRKLFDNFACAISLEPNLFIPCCGTHHRPYGSCKKTFLLGPPNTGFLRTRGGGVQRACGKRCGLDLLGGQLDPAGTTKKAAQLGWNFLSKLNLQEKCKNHPKYHF